MNNFNKLGRSKVGCRSRMTGNCHVRILRGENSRGSTYPTHRTLLKHSFGLGIVSVACPKAKANGSCNSNGYNVAKSLDT
jgi:hypothetical protein